MIKKLLHYYRRYKYKSSYNLLPDLPGGKGANGQDLFILKLLGHKRNGTFIDIGANDGITLVIPICLKEIRLAGCGN